MRTTVTLVFITIILCCNCNKASFDVEDLYLNIKDRDFAEFLNWNLYPRDSDEDILLFDYIIKDSVIARYLIVVDDSIRHQRVFPENDTLFNALKLKHINKLRQQDILKLYASFKSLDIDAIYTPGEDSIIILRKGGISILHTLNDNTNVSNLTRFENYKMIEPCWYYYEDL